MKYLITGVTSFIKNLFLSKKMSFLDSPLYSAGITVKQCLSLLKYWKSAKSIIKLNKKLFTHAKPHLRNNYLRPDGRWTNKGEMRDYIPGNFKILSELEEEDLELICLRGKSNYDENCDKKKSQNGETCRSPLLDTFFKQEIKSLGKEEIYRLPASPF